MTNPTEAQVIYTAGLFDGEGCVGIYRRGKPSENNRRKTPQLMMYAQIASTSEAMIMWLQLTFGGCVSIEKGKSRTKNPHHAKAWRWKTNSRHARWFLELVYPFLIIKKSEVEIALEFQRHLESTKLVYRQGQKGVSAVESNVIAFRQEMADKLKEIKRSNKQYWTVMAK